METTNNYTMTIEENVTFDIPEGYEMIVTDADGVLRKKDDEVFTDGDFIALDVPGQTLPFLAIFRKYKDWSRSRYNGYAYLTTTNSLICPVRDTEYRDFHEEYRPATELEISRLNKYLKIYRWRWEVDTTSLVKLPPEPELGEDYYYMRFDVVTDKLSSRTNNGEEIDRLNIDAKNYFFDYDFAMNAINKINDTINSFLKNKIK